MDVTEIRRLNMRALAISAGGITAFANKLGKSQAQISHLIGRNLIKNIGNKLAREVEQLCKLSHGWFDQSHPELWRQHGLTTNEDALSPVASSTPGAITLSNDEIDLIATYRHGPDKGKALIRRLFADVVREVSAEYEPD